MNNLPLLLLQYRRVQACLQAQTIMPSRTANSALSAALAVLIPSLLAIMGALQTLKTAVCVPQGSWQEAQPPQTAWVKRPHPTAPESAFPDFPCSASTNQQRLYLIKHWLPQWWGLGLRRLLIDGPMHVEFTVFVFTVGLPLLYVAAQTTRKLGLVAMPESQGLHQAYSLLLLCAADVVSPVNSILAGMRPNDFRLPQFTDHGMLYVIALARGFTCILFKVRLLVG